MKNKFSIFNFQFSKKGNGFTLIELIIAIAIIGILSALLMVNFVGVRQRAKDAQRKSDLRQIQSALELYRADQGGYPLSLVNCSSSLMSPDCASVTYMREVPTDPNGTAYYNSGSYYYVGDGINYTLAACIENTNDAKGTAVSPGGSDCDSGFYFILENP